MGPGCGLSVPESFNHDVSMNSHSNLLNERKLGPARPVITAVRGRRRPALRRG